ncbi:DUF4177 domain-containing protein [Rhodovulum strictum]|uniref:DUF4177 domain-containing protein n=2 Tax=Rhodovulum strictum TaxID=58314 RepID=A0A844B2W8_9RHOB|nr:DUF4177 domain-containing protein [Rhodovulum strictum]MRH20451.1 DUF4177 domain-containing protein [Rhodovulum strictum]
MTVYEYKVLPAPERGKRVKGTNGAADRFALALTEILNAMAAEGWEYQRAESLPCTERKGLTGRIEVTQNLLVFRRARPEGTARPLPASPEAIAAAAAASLSPFAGRGFAPTLGAPSREAAPRPVRRLGPAQGDDS